MPGTDFFFTLAYDHVKEGEGSRIRCKALGSKIVDRKLWRVCGTDSHVVLTGGLDPVRDESPLALQMAMYMREKLGVETSMHICPSPGWGTLPEIDSALEYMESLNPSGPVTVFVSTNLGHMPRVLVYMQALKPRGWRIRPVIAWKQNFTWKERLRQEPFKFAMCFAQIARHQWRKRSVSLAH